MPLRFSRPEDYLQLIIQFIPREGLGSAEIVDLADALVIPNRSDKCTGDIRDRNRLDLGVAAAQDRHKRQALHELRQDVDRLVFRAINEGGTEDCPSQAALAHAVFSRPFRLLVMAPCILTCAERAHVQQPFHARLLRFVNHVLRRLDVHPLEGIFLPLANDAYQMNPTLRVLHCAFDRRREQNVAVKKLDSVALRQPRRPLRVTHDGANRMARSPRLFDNFLANKPCRSGNNNHPAITSIMSFTLPLPRIPTVRRSPSSALRSCSRISRCPHPCATPNYLSF